MSEQEIANKKPEDEAGRAQSTDELEETETAPVEQPVEQDGAEPTQPAVEAAEAGEANDDAGEAPGSLSSDDVGPEHEAEEPVEEVDPLQQARAENKKLREQMLRVAADFDNFRKRARRENEDGARRAKIEMLRELLPVFDNMERAVSHAEQAADAKAVAAGVEMVIKQFQDTVGKLGVERVKSVGEAFDPNVHEAIQQIETADQVAGTVVAEMLPGYLWGDRLLRASMVVVAKAPPTPEPEVEAEPEVAEVETVDETVESSEEAPAPGSEAPEGADDPSDSGTS